MIRIEFFRDNNEELLASVEWSLVPRIGESVSIGGDSGSVKEVHWGTHVTGNGGLLVNKPYVVVIIG